MQRKILRFIENLFYYVTLAFAIAFMLISIGTIIINLNTLTDEANNIMAMTAVFTVNSAIAGFIHNIRIKRRDRARHLNEKFENEDYRRARTLARRIRDVDNQGNVTPSVLERLINGETGEDVIRLREECGLTEFDQEKLQESLIFVFNFWEEIYLELVSGNSDEAYLREQLFDIFITQYKRFHFWLKRYEEVNCPEQYKHLTAFYLYAKKLAHDSGLTMSQKLHRWWYGL